MEKRTNLGFLRPDLRDLGSAKLGISADLGEGGKMEEVFSGLE